MGIRTKEGTIFKDIKIWNFQKLKLILAEREFGVRMSCVENFQKNKLIGGGGCLLLGTRLVCVTRPVTFEMGSRRRPCLCYVYFLSKHYTWKHIKLCSNQGVQDGIGLFLWMDCDGFSFSVMSKIDDITLKFALTNVMSLLAGFVALITNSAMNSWKRTKYHFNLSVDFTFCSRWNKLTLFIF